MTGVACDDEVVMRSWVELSVMLTRVTVVVAASSVAEPGGMLVVTVRYEVGSPDIDMP